MKIRELLSRIEYEVVQGTDETEIMGLSRDNRLASPGDLFICTEGVRFDTHDPAVVNALAATGVRAFLVEKDVAVEDPGVTLLRVEETRTAGAYAYAAWYGYPAEKLTMIGITGSKGKTTAAHMLRDVLLAAGRTPGLIGTNGAEFPGTEKELVNTTPDYDELQKYLREMVDAGCDSCVLEVSSQAVLKKRVEGITFDYGVWLNLQEGDHVGPNEHPDFYDYMQCKAKLLKESRVPVMNGDDPFTHITAFKVRKAAEHREPPQEKIVYFGLRDFENYYATGVTPVFDEETKLPGTSFTLHSERLNGEVYINFPGDFHVYNALAAIAVADRMGISLEDIRKGLSDVHIRGREELVYRGVFTVCVDFAHNGASAFAHLSAVRAYRPKRLVCVFGADGNRSLGRRYGMGEAAGRLADFSIVTSGHNRWETFEAILKDTEAGLHKAPDPHYIAIEDREEAIRYAIDHAEPGDFITILGLGHEHWQETMGVKRVYNDGDFVRSVLKEKGLI